MALFSYDHKWIPGWSPHSFALFYGLDESSNITEKLTISWLPASNPADVSVFGNAVPGKNYSLKETLDFAYQSDKKITLSGHYQIADELYLVAKKRHQRLMSGFASYKVLGNIREGDHPVIHCVHAISDMGLHNGLVDGLMETGWAYAESANEKILNHFKKYLIKEVSPFPWDRFYLKKESRVDGK